MAGKISMGARREMVSAVTEPYRSAKRAEKGRILDPHIAAIEGWLAEQPQLTALAIVGRLSEKYPEEFGTKQHSIVQRLLRALSITVVVF
jgi:hypothetical protein